ncbi:MAG: type I 3-dehydroquinate dehydratase [Promethearchaeota archaeon]
MSYKICVALQVKTGNVEENKALIDKALESKPNLIELRWDYIDSIENLTEEFVKALIDHIQPNIPVISTFRAAFEGGQSHIEEDKRFDIIKMLMSTQPQYLDIEMKTDPRFLRKVCHSSFSKKINVIFSYHDFQKTPPIDEARDIVQNFLKSLVTITTMKTDKTGNFLYKVIFTGNNLEDNFVPIKLCKFFTKQGEDRNIISFCMGEAGKFSRLMCVRYGSFMTYASVSDGTAPGQIHIDKIREFYKILDRENQ